MQKVAFGRLLFAHLYPTMIFLARFANLRSSGSKIFGALTQSFCAVHQSPGDRLEDRRLRVLVDMDGVLADFEGGFLQKFRDTYPKDPFIELQDRRGFWVSAQYGELHPDLCEKAISIWESKNFFIELEPIPGAVEAVKEMANLKDTDVFICTSPIKKYNYCPYEKYAWVEKHFGKEFLELIVLTRDKTLVTGNLLIDDKPDISGVEPYPKWEHILFSACHNMHEQLRPPKRRLHSWADDWKLLLDSKRQ
ncbi:5'(3')-deoxyribonucleotidase, mitochondrial-like isoform X2 [Carcharodon carcharias]|uniref:5'(3')-deoxyribonucleotidase, mitochondrial-like isoform X2 n=1 Tax=Carcharodon carcharias TaxID=13397 RepID=UPI001B7EDBFF|nr:5'(3')-deoxyribonucleotidase, mitochondrial-like isoform X2 [Carcharodon carcharias]